MTINNHDTAIIYTTKYGSTERYAKWLAEDAGADLYPLDKSVFNKISDYHTIVFGGPLYAVGLLGMPLLKKNLDRLKGKRLIIFSVGASPASEKALSDIIENNFDDYLKENATHFHLRGAFHYDKLHPVDKMMMRQLKRKLEKKDPAQLTSDEEGMLNSYDGYHDWTDRESLAPIINIIKNDRLTK